VSVGTDPDVVELRADALGPEALMLGPPAVAEGAGDAGCTWPLPNDRTAAMTATTATTAKRRRKPRFGAGRVGRSTTPS
jgi:hypothetical protein